jgi:hypothetical protein
MSENQRVGGSAFPVGQGPSRAAVPPIARELRSDLERTLRKRHFGEGRILYAVEDGAKSATAKVWHRLKVQPYVGIAAASLVGFTLASVTGVGELAFGVLCGYGAYQVLRRGEPVSEAVEEMVRDVCKMG